MRFFAVASLLMALAAAAPTDEAESLVCHTSLILTPSRSKGYYTFKPQLIDAVCRRSELVLSVSWIPLVRLIERN